MATPEDPPSFTTLPTWLLNQTAQHAQRLLKSGFAELDAKGYHYRVLATLDELGPASQATLGRRCGIHLSDLVATINDLTAQDYVRRSPDPADRRRNTISLTPAGRRRLRDLHERVVAIQDELLAPLTAREREQLTALLGRVLAYHTERSANDEGR